ncbi:MAG: TonB-dependent receptor [Ectothiorhodospiraceae bacterium]|nr:TonB-dependent receptor [Ectothiorhodospiraceae bacterium]
MSSRQHGTCLILAGACWLTPCVASANDTALDPLTIEAARPTTTTPSAEEARENLSRIPGATTLVDEDTLRDGRAANLEDGLATVPGVYARSRFGQDETRLSIRGSGISRTFNSRGVRLLRDGLPVTEADGNTRTQLIDPLTARHIEVYRGANAMGHGAATLGGAVNLVSPTGYTADPLRLRGELGSFGYRRLQASGAWMGAERGDAFATITGSLQDGYRRQSGQQALRFYGNTGLQHASGGETRAHLELQDSRLELPGSLTRQEYRNNPRQAAPNHENVDASRDLKLARLTVQHAAPLGGDQRLLIGGFIQDLQMDHPLPFAQIDGDQQDVGLSVRHEIDGRLLGQANRFSWGLLAVTGREDNRQENRFTGAVTERDYRASTVELYADNMLALSERTSLITSAQLSWASRKVEVTAGDAAEARQQYRAISPRLGLLHELTPELQLFANISRSVEPPINGELVGFDDRTLDAQRADSVEAGLRGHHQRLRWEAAVYHARVRDEILLFRDPDNPDLTLAENADRTFHQGVELGLDYAQPLQRGELLVSATWTYHRFRFDGDSQWDDNALPGIPDHLARLELRYQDASGVYLGPVLEAGGSYAVDFANTERADRYLVWGARAGYRSPDGWRVFLDGRNLTDRRYIASTAVVADARDDNRVYNPGAPRSVYGGVEWQW